MPRPKKVENLKLVETIASAELDKKGSTVRATQPVKREFIGEMPAPEVKFEQAKKAPRTKKEPEYKLPKLPATCADHLYTVQQQRLELQREVDALAKKETLLKEHLIATLPKGEATGVQGKLCRVTIVTKVKPQVQDWDAFYEYVRKTKSYDMLQKRLSDTAITARWEAKKEVPGVGRFNAVTVSINKVK